MTSSTTPFPERAPWALVIEEGPLLIKLAHWKARGMNIQQGIQSVVDGVDLSQDDAACVMSQIMGGDVTEAQFGAFVTGLRMKGETAEEIAGMASAMRDVKGDRRRCMLIVDLRRWILVALVVLVMVGSIYLRRRRLWLLGLECV